MTFAMPVVDRSRFSLSWGRCQRARFLNYHAGNGFGFHRKAQSLPLATGIQVHEILESLLLEGPGVGRDKQREIIGKKVEEYRVKTLASDILQLAEEVGEEEGAGDLRLLVEEQAALIEGLAWAAVRIFFPRLYAEYEVVSIEQEEEYVLECSCGLGDGAGTGDEHEARECEGIVLMSRPDLLVRRKADRTLGYIEFKTSGDVGNYDWLQQWQDNVQLALGVVGAEKRLGEEVPNCFVVGFNKGWRKKGYHVESKSYTGAKKQDSPFCYAYRKEANPPLWEEDWQMEYNYTDEDGKARRLGKEYKKSPVWEGEFADRPAGWTKLEAWVEALPLEIVEKQILWVGPLPTPRYLVADLLEALGAEEKRWQERLWQIWEAQEKGREEFLSALNTQVPQSFECRRWGKQCQYLPICRKEPGWEEAMSGQGGEKWVARRPHHERERRLMERVGLEVPGEEESGEVEG